MTLLLAILALACAVTEGSGIVQAGEITAVSWWNEAFPAAANPLLQNAIAVGAGELDLLLALPPDASFHQQVDTARQFVNAHSVHNQDAEFYSHWYDVPYLMKRLAASALDKQALKPHTECATRTALLYHMLEKMSVRERVDVIYNGDDDSHTFLEVFNPETAAWEIQDADFDVFWVFRNTGQRASLEDLLSYPVRDTFIPCRSENDCGYASQLESIVAYFALGRHLDIQEDDDSILINTARYSLLRLFQTYNNPLPEAYCVLFSGGCRRRLVQIAERSAPAAP